MPSAASGWIVYMLRFQKPFKATYEVSLTPCDANVTVVAIECVDVRGVHVSGLASPNGLPFRKCSVVLACDGGAQTKF